MALSSKASSWPTPPLASGTACATYGAGGRDFEQSLASSFLGKQGRAQGPVSAQRGRGHRMQARGPGAQGQLTRSHTIRRPGWERSFWKPVLAKVWTRDGNEGSRQAQRPPPQVGWEGLLMQRSQEATHFCFDSRRKIQMDTTRRTEVEKKPRKARAATMAPRVPFVSTSGQSQDSLLTGHRREASCQVLGSQPLPCLQAWSTAAAGLLR